MASKQEETNGKVETIVNEFEGRIPKWLTANLFEELLCKHVFDFKGIKDFKAEPGTAIGDNYATNMLRIEILMELLDGTTKPVTYMMKLPLDTELMKEMLQKYDIFHNEATMYEQIMPDFEEMYRNAGVDIKFGAQYYQLGIENSLILLEDLRPRGFKNANRTEGLDMAHTKSVLKKLAQWHAASAVRVETKGMYPDCFVTAQFTEESRPMFHLMNNALRSSFVECLNKYEGQEFYATAAKELFEKMTELQYKNAAYDPNEFNVLNHGDCWTNNIMFQYDAEGNIKETYFVDYQIAKYGTPVQDLLYFLISSTKLEIKLENFDYFIRYYHENLVENLKLLKYEKKIPTLRELHMMLYKYGTWAFFTAVSIMGVVLLNPNENANLGIFFSDTEEAQAFKLEFYSNDRYRSHIQEILPWLYNRGLLEY